MGFDRTYFSEPIQEVCDCAARGDLPRLRELLDEYPETLSAFEPDVLRWTPLHHAVNHDQHQAVIELLDRGADPNAHDDEVIGDTPLDLAVEAGRLVIARTLIEAGANPNIPTWVWNTAMDRVIERNIEPVPPGRRDESRAYLELFTAAARRFPPPVYPDGTAPAFWPPTPDCPRPTRIRPVEG